MRIIGGSLKSRRISFPRTRLTRPMTDRAKETIFNVLGSLVQSAFVLDLFAGSGSLGLEALSRGASQVLFIDDSKISWICIENNLKQLGLSEQGSIMKSNVYSGIGALEKRGQKFTLIFLDPPHNKGLIKKILHRLDASDIVASFGTIVVGHSNQEGLPNNLKTLCFQRSIKIGQTFMSFLMRR